MSTGCPILGVGLPTSAWLGAQGPLVVGGVELVLSVIEEDERAFRFWKHAWRHMRLHLLRERRSSRRYRSRGQSAAE